MTEHLWSKPKETRTVVAEKTPEPSPTYSGVYGVIGPPGTGKTTFLAAQVRRIVETTQVSGGRTPVLVSSLTKAAATEIGGRGLPLPEGSVGTLHSHAFRALDRPEVATGPALASWNELRPEFALAGAGRVKPTAKGDDLDGDVIVETFAEDGADSPGDPYLATYDLLRAKKVERERWEKSDPTLPVLGNDGVRVGDLARFVDEYEEWKTRTGLFDFTDLISGAIGVPPPLDPEVLVVDEVQDLSALEWDLVSTWAEGRSLFAVGDPWQALYTWRGAHPELFDAIPKERLRVLSRSYRVPASIVTTALRYMDGRANVKTAIEYGPRLGADGAPVEGRIDLRPDITPANVSDLVSLVEANLAKGRTSMIEATCSFLLPDVLSALRSRGIPFANPWRTKRGDWNPIATRGTPAALRFATFLVPATERRLWSWKELSLWIDAINVRGTLVTGAKQRIEARAEGRGGDVPTTSIELAGYFVDSSVFEVVSKIRELGLVPAAVALAKDWFVPRLPKTAGKSIDYAARILSRFGLAGVRDRPKVYVGTCHSFKGAEADDVFLFTELSGAALRSALGGSEDAVGSIARTFYVGMTRARENLTICGTSNKADRSFPIFRYLQAAVQGVA